MMWDEVMQRVLNEILADPIMSSIYGSEVLAMGSSSKQLVPRLEWMLISDTEGELWAPMIVQFDQFTKTAASLRVSEFRLRSLYHRDTPAVLTDIQMWTQYSDGNTIEVPDRAGFYGRSVRFKFTPLRRQYALPSAGPVML
jgi:hypothetical protein